MAEDDQAAPSQSSEKNRRASKRLAVRASVAIEVRKGSTGLSANLAAQFVDISDGGVRVILKSDLPVATQAEVILNGHGIRKSIKRAAVVCWTCKLESGQFLVGLKFDKHITYKEMTNFARPT